MSDDFFSRPFPRTALVGAAALLSISIALVLAARMSGRGLTQLAPSRPLVVRELRFQDARDGSVLVTEVDARQVARLAPGTNGFVRGVMRGFARERHLAGAAPDLPFRLTHWADGRLSLDDPATGRHVDLEAFGPTNSAAFAHLMTQQENR